jgi:signal transduction histidine kinase
VHGGERTGVIECGPKVEGSFTERDHELLATLARQAALGIHNARLAAELAARLDEIGRQAEELSASRARIVRAQDAERRRLERNLHDGVQQEIISLIAKLRLARNQLERDPGRAEATIAELQGEARQVLKDLRELAQGIHPAVLSDRGLLEAIRSAPRDWRCRSGSTRIPPCARHASGRRSRAPPTSSCPRRSRTYSNTLPPAS